MRNSLVSSGRKWRDAGFVFLLVVTGIVVSAPAAHASAFTIVSVQNEAAGGIGGTGTFQPFSQFFDLVSGSAVGDKILDMNVYDPSTLGSRDVTTFAESEAAGSTLSVSLDQRAGTAESVAAATSDIYFTPTFTGQTDKIQFYGSAPLESWFDGPTAAWQITDVTASSTILSSGCRRCDISQTFLSDALNGASSLGSYDWNATHTYLLHLSLQVGSNNETDGGTLATNMFAIDVPEPPTWLLTLVGFAGLVYLRRRVARAH